jgi:hypothetical protein
MTSEVKEEHRRKRPEFVARQKVEKYFDGASSKTLANLNSQGLGPKPYRNGRIVFYKFPDLVRHFTGE